MKALRFGGPNLPDGTKTWFEYRREDGTIGQRFVSPGIVVDPETVMRTIGGEDGNPALAPAADYYVETQRAEYIEVEAIPDDAPDPFDASM